MIDVLHIHNNMDFLSINNGQNVSANFAHVHEMGAKLLNAFFILKWKSDDFNWNALKVRCDRNSGNNGDKSHFILLC